MKLPSVRMALAIMILVASFSVTGALFFIETPDKNRDLINFVLGAVIGWSGTVISHYFGDPDKQEKIKP